MDVNHSGSTVVRNYNCAQKNDPKCGWVAGWQKCPCPSENVYGSIVSSCFPNLTVISAELFSAVFWLENKRKSHHVLCILTVFVEEKAAVASFKSESCVQLITAWILHFLKSYLKEPNKIKYKSNKTSGGLEHLKLLRRDVKLVVTLWKHSSNTTGPGKMD